MAGLIAAFPSGASASVPLAAYSFDEGSGTTLHDSAGSHDGTVSGATWTSSGKYGSALDFDGTNDLVSVADAADLDLTGSLTLEAWVRPDALGSYVSAIAKAESPASPSGYFLAPQIFTKQPGGYVADTGKSATVNAASALPTGTWSHIALTSDSTNLRFYVNGELAATKTAIAAKATSASLEIGHNQLVNTYFNGLIDEVRVYGEALDQEQIAADRDTAVTPPAPHEFTTSVLDTGPSSEKVSGVPISAAGTDTVVYSLAIPSLGADEVLRATGNLEVSNPYSYDVTDSVRLVLGSNATDATGTAITPWSSVQQTSSMDSWTLPVDGSYRAASSLGSQYLKLILKAASSSAKSGDALGVQQGSGRLSAARYTPTTSPISQPTHHLQPLLGPTPAQITSLPVDSLWRSALSRRISDASPEDILDLLAQLEVLNTSGTLVQIESKPVFAGTPTAAGGPSASPVATDYLLSGMSKTRLAHSNEVTVIDPAKRYVNLLVRAVPLGGSPSPLTISATSGELDALRLEPRPGIPSAPVGLGTHEDNPHWDSVADLSTVPFAAEGAQPRVVNSVPLYGLHKGDVVRGRGVVVANLAGSAAANVKAGLVLTDDPAETTGATVAEMTSDSISSSATVHSLVRGGTYVSPKASEEPKYLNLVVYANRAPAYSGESLAIDAASVSYGRSMPTEPFHEDFEDGTLDQLYKSEFTGPLSVSTDEARDGTKSMLANLDFSKDIKGGNPNNIRTEAHAADVRASGGYEGEESWYGFSAYFPEDFTVGPDSGHFEGLIDEVRLYDEPLAQGQIEGDLNGSYGESPEPVAAYGFDEAIGATAHDSAGSHDGAIEGPAWVSTGKYGSALDFDGKDDRVTIADSNDLDLTSTFTLEAWVRPEAISVWSPAINKTTSVSPYSGYSLNAGIYTNEDFLSTGKPGGFVAAGPIASAIRPTGLPLDAWSHMTLTSDGSNLRLYIDGQLEVTTTAIDAAATSTDLIIGASDYVPGGNNTLTTFFTQWHGSSEGLDCDIHGGLPLIAFSARRYEAGGHTNPGATEPSTPTAGDYIQVWFAGGQEKADCSGTIDPTDTYVLAPLERERWYDFVLHTHWTTDEGEPGHSVSEVWVDGTQMLGDETVPVTRPALYWHGTPSIRNPVTTLNFGLYRHISASQPTSRLYIDSVSRGNSYSEVAPGP